MTTPTIFIDESHNTGANLLDPHQPVFTLASVDYNQDECGKLLRLVPLEQAATEVKFNKLSKNPSGQKKILNFLNSSILSEQRVKTMIVHKRFNVVTQLVDIIEESLMRKDGIDIYKNSANILLANLHWYLTPQFCGEQRFNNLLACFVDMVRNQSIESKTKFFNAALDLHDNCTDKEHKSSLSPYIYAEPFIDSILNGIDKKYYIDPAISSLFCHLTLWGRQLGEPFIAIHDKSDPIKASLSYFEKMIDSAIPSAVIGYGQRKFDFPLKAKELREGDSKQYPALQVADLIVGATRYYYSAFFRNVDDPFARQLEDAGIRRFVFGAIGPQGMEHFQPEVLEINDINPADYMMKACKLHSQ